MISTLPHDLHTSSTHRHAKDPPCISHLRLGRAPFTPARCPLRLPTPPLTVHTISRLMCLPRNPPSALRRGFERHGIHNRTQTHTARPCVTAYTFISLTPGVSSFVRHTLLAGAHKLHHVTKVSTRCGFAPANDPCRVRVPRGGERWSRAKQTTRPPPRTHDAHRGSQHPSGISSLIQIGRCPHLGGYRPRRVRAGRGMARPCALA